MILEPLIAVCDACAEANPPRDGAADVETLAALGYRASKRASSPTLFYNHTHLSRTLVPLGWYIDARRMLCPAHYQEMLDAQREREP